METNSIPGYLRLVHLIPGLRQGFVLAELHHKFAGQLLETWSAYVRRTEPARVVLTPANCGPQELPRTAQYALVMSFIDVGSTTETLYDWAAVPPSTADTFCREVSRLSLEALEARCREAPSLISLPEKANIP